MAWVLTQNNFDIWLAQDLSDFAGTGISWSSNQFLFDTSWGDTHYLSYDITSSNWDHGGLLGLTDDDHTHYVLANGTRNITGDFEIEGSLTLDDAGACGLIMQGATSSHIYMYEEDANETGDYWNIFATTGDFGFRFRDVSLGAWTNVLRVQTSGDIEVANSSIVLDEDNMASDSATKLATQQSIKAYVDASIAPGGSDPVMFKRNLVVACSSNTVITITADDLVVEEQGATTYSTILLEDVSETITITTSGAGGLDTGYSETTSYQYYVHIISDTSSTVAGLLSGSATAPNLPAGYTHFRCVGEAYNDASGNLLWFTRHDDKVEIPTYWSIYTNTTLGTTWNTGYALPAFVPWASVKRIRFAGVATGVGVNWQGVSHSNTGYYSFVWSNYQNTAQNTYGGRWGSGKCNELHGDCMWFGESTVYTRAINAVATTTQDLAVIGYWIPR